MAIDRTHDSLEGDDLSGQLALSSCVASAPVYELSDPEFQVPDKQCNDTDMF